MRNDNLAGESGAVSFSERLGKKPTRGVFLTAFVTAGARAESAVRLRARPGRAAGGGAQPGVTARVAKHLNGRHLRRCSALALRRWIRNDSRRRARWSSQTRRRP